LVLKSAKDNRYASDEVVSHDGAKRSCIALKELRKLPSTEFKETDVIAIDEAQFFPDLLSFCQKRADEGKHVVVAGLDGDFRRRRFGETLDLIPIADSVTKLTAKCSFCGTEAPFTLRKVAREEQTLIGGSDMYLPVCREHYIEHSESSAETENEKAELPSKVRTRLAREGDIEAIASFQVQMAKDTEDMKLDALLVRKGVQKVLDDPTKGFYVVSTDNERVVGSLLITYEWSDWRNTSIWYINSVYLQPEFRGQGRFREIFDFTAKLFQSEGDKLVRLYVERDNSKAQAVYASLGMQELPYLMYEIEIQ